MTCARMCGVAVGHTVLSLKLCLLFLYKAFDVSLLTHESLSARPLGWTAPVCGISDPPSH